MGVSVGGTLVAVGVGVGVLIGGVDDSVGVGVTTPVARRYRIATPHCAASRISSGNTYANHVFTDADYLMLVQQVRLRQSQ